MTRTVPLHPLMTKQDKTPNSGTAEFSPLFARHLQSRDYDFYGEGEFRSMIQRERKRTERSKNPFVLVLVNTSAFRKNKGRTKLLEKIAFALCGCSRKTDINGWYKKGLVFGTMFVDLEAFTKEIDARISEKVWRALGTALRPDELQKVRMSLHAYPEQDEAGNGRHSLFDLCLYPDLSRRHRTNVVSLVFKRLIDILGSAFALMVLSPLFAVIALLIRLSSPGPVFYRQRRVCLAGNHFTLYKFRSMYADSDPGDHMDYIRKYISGDEGALRRNGGDEGSGIYKMVDDHRITPLGRILRKTSLDELPQFFNVFKGDMTLVGPRPPIQYECDSYEVWHRRRILEAKPGLTGLWQVKGRSATTFDEMVRMDLQYAKDRSFWLDLRILLLTPVTVLHGKGAY